MADTAAAPPPDEVEAEPPSTMETPVVSDPSVTHDVNPWAQFGWEQHPGSLVTVTQSPLDALMFRIGTQLQRQQTEIEGLRKRADAVDEVLTEVANNKDAIDSLRTELNDRFTSVESRIEELMANTKGDPVKHVGPIDLRLAAMEEAAAKSHNALMRVEQEAVDQEKRLLKEHLSNSREAVASWHENMDSMENEEQEAKDGDKHPNKLGRLLRQWSDLQHDVVPRVREMITSQTMLQQASSRLSTLRGDAPGKTPRRTPRMLSSRRHTPASTPRGISEFRLASGSDLVRKVESLAEERDEEARSNGLEPDADEVVEAEGGVSTVAGGEDGGGDGKAGDGADGADGAGAGAGADGGNGNDGDDGDGGDDGAGKGAGAAAALYGPNGERLHSVDEIVAAVDAAQDRLANLFGSFSHQQRHVVQNVVRRDSMRDLDAALATLREELGNRIDDKHSEALNEIRTAVSDMKAVAADAAASAASRRRSSATPKHAPAPAPAPAPTMHLSGSNIVTKEDFDAVVEQVERVSQLANTNSESLVDVNDRVATNEEHLVEHDGRLDKLEDKLHATDSNANTLQQQVDALTEAMANASTEPGTGPPPEAALRSVNAKLSQHSDTIKELFDKMQSLPDAAPRRSSSSEGAAAAVASLSDEMNRMMAEHAQRLSELLARQADAEKELVKGLRKKADIADMQDFKTVVSRKADEAWASGKLNEKVDHRDLDSALDEYMKSLDARLDAVCATVRDERQLEVTDMKRKFKQMLRDQIAKALAENQRHGDNDAKANFGRTKLTFCASCDRPVRDMVGVPVPIAIHQRLPTPSQAVDDFVYRGGGFRVPSRQTRQREAEARDNAWNTSGRGTPTSGSRHNRPHSANYNYRHRRSPAARPSSRGGHPTTPVAAQAQLAALQQGEYNHRPNTAPANATGSARSHRRSARANGGAGLGAGAGARDPYAAADASYAGSFAGSDLASSGAYERTNSGSKFPSVR